MLCSPLVYAATASPHQNFAEALRGQTVLLRGMEMGGDLAFDAQGTEVGTYKTGSFADSGVAVKKVHESKSELIIEGNRAVWFFDTESQSQSIDDIQSSSVKAPITITIARDPANPDALGTALQKVFAASVQDALAGEREDQIDAKLATLGSLAPPINAPTLAQAKDQRTMPAILREGAYTLGVGVTPPQMTYYARPIWPHSARKSRTGGITILSLIINPEGEAIHIRVAQSSGHDLDAAAIVAVSQFRFTPAIYQGTPVPVWMNTRMIFYIKKNPF